MNFFYHFFIESAYWILLKKISISQGYDPFLMLSSSSFIAFFFFSQLDL